MRILFMMPAAKGVYPPEAEERRVNLMRSYATPSTQIDVDFMPGVSGFNPFGGGGPTPETAARATELAVQRIVQAEKEGYDAFLPFGTLDIGVEQGRGLVKIPVVGQAEAAMLWCGLMGRRFATVQYESRSGFDRIRQLAQRLGVDHLLVLSTAVEMPNPEMPKRRQELKERYIACAREAQAKGAEIMGLTAMSICPVEYSARELSEACGLPVLDAVACQVALAEAWHRLGVPYSLLRSPRSAD